MNATTNWQQTAVTLFEKATARLGDDARQLQQSVSWLQRVAPVAALRGDAHWLQPILKSDLKL